MKKLLSIMAFTVLFFSLPHSSLQAATPPVYIDNAHYDANARTVTVRFYNPAWTAKTILVDLELYGSNGAKIKQEFYDNEHFSPSQSTTYTMTIPTDLPAGDYRFAIGEFAPGWTSLYEWRNTAVAFTIGNNPTPNFNVNGVNQTQAAITSDSDTQVLVDLELYDRWGNRTSQKFYDYETLRRNETKTYALGPQFLTPANSPYTLKVGIFKPGWSNLIAWFDQVTVFDIAH
jgi:hypothetical protein